MVSYFRNVTGGQRVKVRVLSGCETSIEYLVFQLSGFRGSKNLF